MRIQHNIMAMNAYRNYNTNTSALSKNLEKLSSGYRINRAGDDAAGLAISEKMRGQITGLEAAQKNVKDGVSLVKTAEGAMQEIHDMLGRMKYLATQSANGTYDNEVDRANIQKEVNSLKEEINRIADSANFNGQKLLDGSLSGSAVNGKGVPNVDGLMLQDVVGTNGKGTIGFDKVGSSGNKALKGGEELTMEVTYKDASGKLSTSTVKVNVVAASGGKLSLTDGNGKTYATTTATDGSIEASTVSKAFAGALKDTSLGGIFTARPGTTTGQIDIETKEPGNGAGIISAKVNWAAGEKPAGANTNDLATAWTNGADSFKEIDFSAGAKKYTSGDVFTVGGKKFAFASSAAAGIPLGKDVHVVVTNGAINSQAVKDMKDLIKQQTGYEATIGANTNTKLQFKADPNAGTVGGLKLQIGDTSDEYNQMNVTVGDMHTKALGIANVDLSNQDGAAAAVQLINDAINSVSSTRGDLGAIQNRLEHTEKNLSVMQENIQQAESNIRDTDVAAEMMAYTKNNILIQSAQAMLAQANQVPQGVLQLLQ